MTYYLHWKFRLEIFDIIPLLELSYYNSSSSNSKERTLYWINIRKLNRVPSIKYLSYIY